MRTVSRYAWEQGTRMGKFYEHERSCDECGNPFWGTARARYCSAVCRVRHWRAVNAHGPAISVSTICIEILARQQDGGGSYSKLLPRFFRGIARDLRARGWDPIQLLLATPDEPVTASDDAPGGIEGSAPNRRRWLHPPEREIILLDEAIALRLESKRSIEWHLARRQQLQAALAARVSCSASSNEVP